MGVFDETYATGRPARDIDGPQPDFERLVDSGLIAGRVLDVGCGTGELAMRAAVAGAHAVLRPGGTYSLMCATTTRPGPDPSRATRERIAELFADGWYVKSVEAATFERVAGATPDDDGSEPAWLARIERLA